jgi:hypothetical protein
VATLAEARGDAAVLKQLSVGAGPAYPVTAEQARGAQLHLVCPLSALAPRMRHLEEALLPPAVRVRLAVDVRGDAERLRKAAGPDAPLVAFQDPFAVGRETDGAGLLRRFLPTEEGGTDASKPINRRGAFEAALVPLEALPPLFADPDKFPPNVGLGGLLHNRFESFFTDSVLQPGRPRDNMLRGHFDKAAPALVDEKDLFQRRQGLTAREENLEERVNEWVDKQALPAYQDYQKAVEDLKRHRGDAQAAAVAQAERRIAEVWGGKEAVPARILIDAAAAGPRLAEITWLLALCKHEQAEQPQARIDAARRRGAAPDAADVEAAAAAWPDAVVWWRAYLDNHPGAPGRVEARRHLARALAALGQRDVALRLLEDTSDARPADKVAMRYLAARLRD